MMKLSSQWPLQMVEPQTVGLSAERLTRINDVIARYVDEGRIAGAITLVARRGGIAHLEAQGLMDIERRKAMSLDAIFRIYSMTKLITSAAVLMLMEEGRFLLDDPVARYIPEFGQVRVKVAGADGQDELVRPKRPVTIHDLMTHLGGLDYSFIRSISKQTTTLAEYVRQQCRVPLLQHPGEKWCYSASTDVLGYLVEVISGRPFDEFLRQRIFEPLGMSDTDFYVPAEKIDRLASIYKYDLDGKLVEAEERSSSPYLSMPALPSGGGGLVSSSSDYLRFALMLLNGGVLGDVRLMGCMTVELMASDHLPQGHPPTEANNRGFGLGVSVLRDFSETHQIGSIGEFGWGGAACTQVWIDPAEEMISMIMLQLTPGARFPLMDLFKQAACQAVID